MLTTRHVSHLTPVTLTAALALTRLNREGPLRLTALAAAEGVSQPSMTQLIQRLEKQGFTTRINDPGDGRAALVGVTDTGRKLLDDWWSDRRDRLAELLASLSREDETALTLAMHVALPIIRKLIDNANQSPSASSSRSPNPGPTERLAYSS